MRDVERELRGQPAREDLRVLLKPRVQVPSTELAELIVRVGGPPPVLVRLGRCLGSIGSCLPTPAPGPSPPSFRERCAPTRPEAR
jgi:hypothetical protein